jgi:hypothetical protein
LQKITGLYSLEKILPGETIKKNAWIEPDALEFFSIQLAGLGFGSKDD